MNDNPHPRKAGVLPIDERPGRVPKITLDGLNIEYTLVVRASQDTVRLILRCDISGAVFASIQPCG